MMLKTPDKGRYKAKITSVEEKTNKAGSGTNLVMEFTIDDGPFTGRALQMHSPLGHDFGIANIRAAYVSACMPDAEDTSDVDVDTDEMLGKSVVIEVGHQIPPNGGSPMASVEMVLPPDTTVETPFD